MPKWCLFQIWQYRRHWWRCSWFAGLLGVVVVSHSRYAAEHKTKPIDGQHANAGKWQSNANWNWCAPTDKFGESSSRVSWGYKVGFYQTLKTDILPTQNPVDPKTYNSLSIRLTYAQHILRWLIKHQSNNKKYDLVYIDLTNQDFIKNGCFLNIYKSLSNSDTWYGSRIAIPACEYDAVLNEVRTRSPNSYLDIKSIAVGESEQSFTKIKCKICFHKTANDCYSEKSNRIS